MWFVWWRQGGHVPNVQMALEKAKVMDVKAHEEKMRRPTGREWFEGGKGGKDEPALGEAIGKREVGEREWGVGGNGGRMGSTLLCSPEQTQGRRWFEPPFWVRARWVGAAS